MHPFSQAYTAALKDDGHHSPLLEAWGRDLYDAVDPRLRGAVLQLATAAACERPKGDASGRLTDWLGRVEPVRWFHETGLLQSAVQSDEGTPAVEVLVEGGLIALDQAAFVWHRESMRNIISCGAGTGLSRDELLDLEELLTEPLHAVVRPFARTTAQALCDQFGIAPDTPAPAGHPVYELGACCAAVLAAVKPLVHSAHLREMEAFRLIALGLPFPL